MAQTTTSKHRRPSAAHGPRIYQSALRTVFPLPKQEDLAHVRGLLAGFTAALDAIGYDYRPDNQKESHE